MVGAFFEVVGAVGLRQWKQYEEKDQESNRIVEGEPWFLGRIKGRISPQP